MYLRRNRRLKDGKEHCYWNIVESKRCAGGKVVQRQVLYLGEINDSQREASCEVIEAFDEGSQPPTQVGWPAHFMSSLDWMSSGRGGCRRRVKAPVGITSCRRWCATG